MAANFDTDLPTNRDKVRFLINDTTIDPVSEALFSDEAIEATLADAEENAFQAAGILARLMTVSPVRLYKVMARSSGGMDIQGVQDSYRELANQYLGR